MITARQPGGARQPTRRPTRKDPTRAARLQRDAAFERSRSITKGIAVASVAAMAGLAAYVSHAFPGHSSTPTGSTSGTSTNSAGSGATSTGSSSSGGSTGSGSSISAPANNPSSSYQQAPVVSGSS